MTIAGPSIVLCATQRCGSTLVCEDLRNNALGMAEEHFLEFVKKPSVSGEDMVRAVAGMGTDEGGAFSVKIMASYAGAIDARLGGGEETLGVPRYGGVSPRPIQGRCGSPSVGGRSSGKPFRS